MSFAQLKCGALSLTTILDAGVKLSTGVVRVYARSQDSHRFRKRYRCTVEELSLKCLGGVTTHPTKILEIVPAI